MLLLILVGFAHWAIPDSRWLLVHMFTIGLVANSILLWSQTLGERFLGYHLPETRHRLQLVRIYTLNAGLVVTIGGVQLARWPVTLVGAVLIGAVVAWHAVAMALLIVEAQRHRVAAGEGRAEHAASVWFFVASAVFLPVGAGFGVALAYGFADPTQAGFLVAHQAVNILGFLGLAAAGVLTVMFPRLLGDDQATARRRPAALAVLIGGITVICGGALSDRPAIAAVGVAVYALGWIVVAAPFVKAIARRLPDTYASASIVAALLWLFVSLALYGDTLISGPFVVERITLLTVPFLAGFAGQLLIGVMSHLLPTMMGGGQITAAGSAQMNRWWLWRVLVINGGLMLWLLPDLDSWVKVALSSLVMLAYIMFFPIMMSAGISAVRVRRALAADPPTVAQRAGQTVPGRPQLALQGVAAASAIALVVAVGTAMGGGMTGAVEDASAGATPTGQTTTVNIDAVHMRFTPDTATVPAGNRLVIRVTNRDTMIHDLVLATGKSTGRIVPGAVGVIDAGIIGKPVEGWCSIVGHRQQGMVFHVQVPGGPNHHDMGEMNSSASGPAAVVDLMKHPAPSFAARDARLAPAPPANVHRYTFEATEGPGEVAPGVRQTVWTYNGAVMGPTLRGKLGDVFEITLVNKGTMAHSVDFHAGMVSPDVNMRDINPGESLVYRFRAEHTGIWLYHCATMPMAVHLAAGMFGAVIIDPPGLAPVTAEYLVTQSEWYLGPDGGPIDADKVARGAPDLVMFNGYADQYVYRPLRAKVGDRIRMWVLDAGPNEPLSFHVIGTQFDTVYQEGAYSLRPDDSLRGGAQVLGLLPAEGGFVELTFLEPGTYTFLNHRMFAGDRGAMGKIVVEK